MNKDKCVTKYCRGEVVVVYLGKSMCQECYEKQCDLEDEQEELVDKLRDREFEEQYKAEEQMLEEGLEQWRENK